MTHSKAKDKNTKGIGNTLQLKEVLAGIRRDYQRARKLLDLGKQFDYFWDELSEEDQAKIIVYFKNGDDEAHFKLKNLVRSLKERARYR